MEANRLSRYRDAVAALVVMSFSTFVFFYLIPAGVPVPSAVKHLPLSPRFLPYVLVIFIFIVASIMLFLSLTTAPKTNAEDELSETSPAWGKNLATLFLVLLMYWILPDRIGMLLTAIASMFLLLFIGGEKRLIVLAGVGVLAPTIIYFVFTEVFYVPLPSGTLFQN